jgi:ribonuclease HII
MSKRSSAPPPVPSFEIESRYWERGLPLVVGTDECGRGPLCAGVTAGAAVVSPTAALSDFDGWLRDSKTLPEAKIREYAARIRRGELAQKGLLAWGIGRASPSEIDRMNIRRASILAMRRAVEMVERRLRRAGRLGAHEAADFLLVDGTPVAEIGREHHAVVRGDATVVSISLGALIAKDAHNRMMQRLAVLYPQFACWAKDKGYPSPAHLAALAEHGPVRGVHRMSFGPVSQVGLFV